jgi:ferritin-like metal-binding protein YciE
MLWSFNERYVNHNEQNCMSESLWIRIQEFVEETQTRWKQYTEEAIKKVVEIAEEIWEMYEKTSCIESTSRWISDQNCA